MQKQGEWKPYNVKALKQNVALVFKTGDIDKLNNSTYTFIINHMGFIAHYDLHGFQWSYADLDEFKEKLQTSEYSEHLNHNWDWADSYEGDRDFNKWYGAAYCKSVAEGIRGIITVARNQSKQATLPIPARELVRS